MADIRTLKTKHISMVSLLVDDMDIVIKFRKDMTQTEFGYTLALEVIRKIHKGEDSLYNLVGSMVGVDPAEVPDMDLMNLIGVIKEIYKAIENFMSPPEDTAKVVDLVSPK